MCLKIGYTSKMAAVYENRENDDIALCLFGQTGICFRVVNYCTILYMPFVLFEFVNKL